SVSFPDSHDGHSGYVIEPLGGRKGLLPLIPANTSKFTPHVVLLHIGTNDLNSELEVASAPQRLARVIDAFLIGAPDALLVVAQLIPTRTDSLNDAVETYNAATAELVAARVASGKHIVLVDHYSAFQENPKYRDDYLFDGLHPNDAGYAAMADVWYEAISRFLR
ncbi:MAG TPA: SGNH/GDSL hydrolase family protein, partial [Polyangiaceae bacterium]|nr:SGNH/GDSL hydrolase family protein [Polyangiaceae bacterium]